MINQPITGMREIKFNVLIIDKDGKVESSCYEWLDEEGWHHDYYSPMIANCTFHIKELGDGFLGKVIRRQYTGLRDKAEAEIYEVDLLEGHSDGLVKVAWVDARWQCIFDDECNIGLDEMCIWFGNNSKVIGNIYTHPELLTP